MNQLQLECSSLVRRYKRQEGALRWRRKSSLVRQLIRQLGNGRRLLSRAVKTPPLIRSSHHAYLQTYQLLLWRVDTLIQYFRTSSTLPVLPQEPKSTDLDLWEDHYDELDDRIEKAGHTIRSQDVADRLAVIELLDALDRTYPYKQTSISGAGIHRLVNAHKVLRQAAQRYLHRANVRTIPIDIGTYPPVGTTRIVSDDGMQFDSDIVIADVVETGYRWGNSILRTAAVTVSPKPNIV